MKKSPRNKFSILIFLRCFKHLSGLVRWRSKSCSERAAWVYIYMSPIKLFSKLKLLIENPKG